MSEGLAIANKTDERCQEAELHRLRGEIVTIAGGDLTKAEEHFSRSLATAKRQHSKAWQLRTSVSLARLYRSTGRPSEAVSVLSEACGGYSEGFDFPDLKEASSLLRELAT